MQLLDVVNNFRDILPLLTNCLTKMFLELSAHDGNMALFGSHTHKEKHVRN